MLVALAAFLFCFPTTAQARVGGLDPSFGVGGKVVTQFSPAGGGQAIASDGSVLLAVGSTLTRFTSSGVLDDGFGAGSRIEVPKELEGLPISQRSYAIDSQGRILVYGLLTDSSQKYVDPFLLRSFEATWAVVMRMLPNGTLDPSFGEGRGFIWSDFGLRTAPPRPEPAEQPQFPTTRAGVGLVDSQDRPVFVAEALALTDGHCFYGKGFMSPYPKAVVRLTAAGRLDPAFGGGDGVAEISGGELGARLQLDGADGLVVATNRESCELRDNVFRFDAGGLPIAAFGSSGQRSYPGFSFFAAAPAGKLTFAGIARIRKRHRPTLLRTDPSGRPDPTFGKGGKTAVNLPAGAERWWTVAGVDSSGRTVLVGTFDLPAPRKANRFRKAEKRRPPRSYLFVKRLLSNGMADPAFGTDGRLVTRFQRPRFLSVNGAQLDSQGRLVVLLGSVAAHQLPGARLTLVRYLLDG